MAIQPASTTLSRYLTENQQEVATQEAWKATMYKVAYIVSAIAVVAIGGGLSAYFLGIIAETALSGWGVAAVLGAWFAAMISSNLFFSWMGSSIEKSASYQKYADTFKEIEDWTTADVEHFFEVHDIDMSRYTPEYVELLHEKAPEAPFKGLLPLIARFKVADALAVEEDEIAQRQVAGMTAETSSEGARHWHRAIHDMALERKSYHKLEAAFYLHCLAEPSFAAPANDVEFFQSIVDMTPEALRAERCRELRELGKSSEPTEIRPVLLLA